ncbi:hypothetical protein ABE073_04820 [Lederbergia citrisecunda]|uniref:hypothetical protein n=1 Tax=Lederbergia citrisecunda TaxID=2833583 RepID=UPI003D2B3195
MKPERIKWTDDLVREELLKSISILGVERMPTRAELVSLGRNDLHCRISRTKKYSGWAEELGLKLKESETALGHEYERVISNVMKKLGYKAVRMSTKHPYDLLVEDSVKVDVKVANVYLLRGESRVHTIGLSKSDPTCDIYICVLLDEQKEIERTLIIPSHHVRMKYLNIGRESKYNIYNEKYHYIKDYINFFKKVV